MKNFEWFIPTRLFFGPGCLSELGRTLHLPGRRALVVVSAGGSMVRQGHLARVLDLLSSNGTESVVFDHISPNPTSHQVEEGAALFLRSGCDFTLGLGGGSSLDSAKAIAFLAANPGRFWDYMVRGSGGRKSPDQPAFPMVAVPTTSGTGSEINPWLVISKSRSTEKAGYGIDSTFPRLALVDPELTVSLPRRQTAYTGLDALYHAVEAFLSRSAHSGGDLPALEAVRLIGGSLPRAVDQGSDLEARSAMSWASTLAGMCEVLVGVISLHAMGLSLGGLFPEMPHGAGLTLLAPAYFRFLEARAPERFGPLVEAMAGPGDEFSARLDRLIDRAGLAQDKLSDFGVGPGDVPELVENTYACAGKHFEQTPFQMTREDVFDLFSQSIQ